MEKRTIEIFSSKFPFGSSISLLKSLIFFIYFKGIHNCLLSIFIIAASKSWSNNSDISIILVLVYFILFLFSEIFLVLEMTSDFLLKLGVSDYVLRSWILIKPSVLTGFIWHYSGKEGKALSYCQVDIEVQVSHSASTDTWGRGLPLCWFPTWSSMTLQWGWPCYYWMMVKVLTLHWTTSDITSPQRGGGEVPPLCLMEVELQVPHMVFTSTVGVSRGGERRLLLLAKIKILASWPSLMYAGGIDWGASLDPGVSGSLSSPLSFGQYGWGWVHSFSVALWWNRTVV